MKDDARKFRKWLVWTGTVLLLALAFPMRVLAHGPVEGGASNETFWDLFNVTFLLALPVFLLVEGLLIFAIIRYRRRDKDEVPEQVEGNSALEITWTVLSFALIAVLFALTVRALQTAYFAEADSEDTTPDYMIHVQGYMFNWDYTYFVGDGNETGVTTTRTVKVPTNSNVLLEITSRDVQHSFWVPELAGKVDAIPGYTNTMWLNIDEPGLYKGNCAEFCGLNHYEMVIELEAMPPAEFDAWLTEQQASAGEFVPIGTDLESPLPEGDAASGEALFNELGCNACHGEENRPSGPAVSQMAEDARTMAEGDDAEARHYLRESILDPCAVLAEGYEQCIMPQDYGEKMDAQGLADVIEYLMQQGG